MSVLGDSVAPAGQSRLRSDAVHGVLGREIRRTPDLFSTQPWIVRNE